MVIRYVERNPVRAKLVHDVCEWKHSSLYRRVHGSTKQKKLLTTANIALPEDYVAFVQTPLTLLNLSQQETQQIRVFRKEMKSGGMRWSIDLSCWPQREGRVDLKCS